MWIFSMLLGVAVLLFIARSQLGKTPISLSSVQTSRGDAGCEVIVSVDRIDRWVGMRHGAPPALQRAWLSDESGKELPGNLLSPMTVPALDSMKSLQFGWRVAQTIPRAPGTVVFHATFTAPGARPFNFEQDLRDGIDFNFKEKDKKHQNKKP